MHAHCQALSSLTLFLSSLAPLAPPWLASLTADVPAAVAQARPAIPYSALSVGVPRESFPGERRVALTPASAALLLKQGFREVLVEAGAGHEASYDDQDYVNAGAKIVSRGAAFASDVVLKIRPPSVEEEVPLLKAGGILMSYIYPARNEALVKALAAKKMDVVGMDCIPRTISRAQAFDTLTSMVRSRIYRDSLCLGAPWANPFILDFLLVLSLYVHVCP